MDTKSFELLIHSQYAFDVCRNQVQSFEDCRQSNNPTTKDPMNCRQFARDVVGCYNQAERVHPLCVAPLNDSRECMFKADGNLLSCRDYIDQFVNCQKNENDYKDFLAASTLLQRQPATFDFHRYRGHFDPTTA